MSGVASRLASALGSRDLTWLAKETGIPLSTISDYKRGKLPRVDNAIKIARRLEVSVEWLFEGESRPRRIRRHKTSVGLAKKPLTFLSKVFGK